MNKTNHIMISNDGRPLARWQAVFPQAKTIAFGSVVPTDADVVWLKLDNLEQAKPQVEWLKKHYSQKFVVLSNLPVASEALMAISLGAKAYANTHAGPLTLKQISQVVVDGGIWVGEDLMQILVTAVGRSQEKMVPQANLDWQAKLSQREIEVTQAIAKGASNKVVARQLDISERTVKAHVTAIFEKLGVTDRLKLVLLVTEMS